LSALGVTALGVTLKSARVFLEPQRVGDQGTALGLLRPRNRERQRSERCSVRCRNPTLASLPPSLLSAVHPMPRLRLQWVAREPCSDAYLLGPRAEAYHVARTSRARFLTPELAENTPTFDVDRKQNLIRRRRGKRSLHDTRRRRLYVILHLHRSSRQNHELPPRVPPGPSPGRRALKGSGSVAPA